MGKRDDREGSEERRATLNRLLPGLGDDEKLQTFLREFRLDEHVKAIEQAISSGMPMVAESRALLERSDSERHEEDTLAARIKGSPSDESLLPEPPHFIGRDDDRRWLTDHLTRDWGRRSALLRGIGGIGKTALAAVVIRQLLRQGCFRDGLAVVLCHDVKDASEVLRRVLARFDPQRREPPDTAGPADLARLARSTLDGKDVLVVLDDVEPDLPVQIVIDALVAAGAALLLTARQEFSPSVIPAEATREVGLLSPSEAIELFAEWMRRGDANDLTPPERAAAERIVKTLNRHTLAIKLAGAYAAEPRVALEALAGDIEEDPRRALVLPDWDTPQALARIFEHSVKHLRPDAHRLFTALAAFATEEFGTRAVRALASAIGVEQPDESIRYLVIRALLYYAPTPREMTAESDRERLRMHVLLRAYAAQELATWPEAECATAQRTVATHFSTYVNQVEKRSLSADQGNIADALAWAHEHGETDLVLDLCYGMGAFWRDRWMTEESLRYLPWAIERANAVAARTGTVEAERRAADLVLTYGQILRRIGRVDAAEEAFTANLAFRRKVGDRRGEAAVLHQLGQLARSRGRLDEAERYFHDSMHIRQDFQDREDREREAADLGYLGRIAQARGQLGEAEGYFGESLRIARDVGDQGGEGVVLSQLGQIAQARGRLAEAEGYFDESLTIRRAVPDRQGEAVDLAQLGQLARSRGQLEEAEFYCQQSLAIRQEIQDRRGEGVVRSMLGQIAKARGNLDAAERYHAESLAVRREVQDQQGVGAELGYLGRIAQARGRLDEAKDYFDKSLPIRRELQDRRGEAADLGYLGRIAQARGRLDEAEDYFRQSLHIAQQAQDRRGEGIVLSLLGSLAQARERYPEARDYFEHSLAIRREVQDRQGEGNDLLQLAVITEMQRDLGEAEKLYQQSLEIGREVQSGEDSANAALALGRFLVERRYDRERGCALIREAVQQYDALGLPRAAVARQTVATLGCH